MEIIRNIFESATTTLQLHTMVQHIQLKLGLRQADTISLKLFSCTRICFQETGMGQQRNTRGPRKLHNLKFADDIVLTSDNLGEVSEIIKPLQMATQKDVLRINYSNTKLMTNLVPCELIQNRRNTHRANGKIHVSR